MEAGAQASVARSAIGFKCSGRRGPADAAAVRGTAGRPFPIALGGVGGLSCPTPAGVAEASETEQHHSPGRRLRDCNERIYADKREPPAAAATAQVVKASAAPVGRASIAPVGRASAEAAWRGGRRAKAASPVDRVLCGHTPCGRTFDRARCRRPIPRESPAGATGLPDPHRFAEQRSSAGRQA